MFLELCIFSELESVVILEIIDLLVLEEFFDGNFFVNVDEIFRKLFIINKSIVDIVIVIEE